MMRLPTWARVAGAGALTFLIVSGAAWAQRSSAGGAFRAPSEAVARLKVALQQINMRTCAPTTLEAAEFIFDGSDAQFVVQPLGPDPNRWPTVLSAESSHGLKGDTRLTTLIVAPAGSCSGLYQQVIYWPQRCDVVKKEVFGAFSGEKVSSRNIRVSEASPALQLQLMPAGDSGCVSIKKELIG